MMTIVDAERFDCEMTIARSAPPWLLPGAVFMRHGGSEKVVSVSTTRIDTASSDTFITWDAAGFHLAVASGEIQHRPDGRQIRPPKAILRSARPSIMTPAAQILDDLYRNFRRNEPARSVILSWMRAIRHGLPAEPWQHILGLALIELGAEQAGLGQRVATPSGPGARSARQAEAIQTQLLILRFDNFLGGGEPISLLDWGWLQSLLERGMVGVGLMPAPKPTSSGRPAEQASSASMIVQAAGTDANRAKRGWWARVIRASAEENVLRRRQVQAAWRGEDHTRIIVDADDPDIAVEVIRISTSVNKLRSRARRKVR